MGEELAMRIAIDIKCLRYNNSGIGRYLKCMLDALQKLDTENEYLLFSPTPIDYPISNPNFKLCPIPGIKILGRNLPGIFWQQTTLVKALRQNKVDIVWGPEQTLPVPPCACKKILTVHDFVYKRYPETMQRSVRCINNTFGEKSILCASKIALVSEFTKQELQSFYPQVPNEKLVVIPNGANVQDSSTGSSQDLRKKQLLFVGSLEPRKNLKNLVAALEILGSQGIEIPLILTGPKGWKNETEIDLLKNSPIAKNIRHLGFVSDSELRNLYATSAAVIFPSLYEGFGLPVLEALAMRTPILTTRGSVMESIAGKCGIYFDATQPKDMARVIKKFFEVAEPWKYLDAVETERLQILSTYRWENSARKLMEVFNELR